MGSSSLILSALTGFVLGFGLTPLAARVAQRVGLVDRPNSRKHHERPTPLVGGPVLLIAALACFLLYGSAKIGDFSLLAALLLLAGTGLWDDRQHLHVRWRFLVQVAAALLMIESSGITVASLGNLGGGGVLTLGPASIPFTVFAIVGVINAINMIDGVDGLAGGICLVTLLLFSSLTQPEGASAYQRWLIADAMGGALAGFLAYNAPSPWRRQAVVFLGDSGSTVLGFLVAWLAVEGSQAPSHTPIAPILVVWFLAVPIMDTVGVMLRRILMGKSPFHPDRSHIHHLLLRYGWSTAGVTYGLCAAQLLMGAGAWLMWYSGMSSHALFLGFMEVFGAYFVAASIALYQLRRSSV